MKNKVTLDIVSGFLGAGKTTYIQALLVEVARRNDSSEATEKVIYVVNEFGEIGIDATLMSGSNVPSYELANGCICCSLKSEFALTMNQIIEEHKPDRIIFEPSGLFILSEMLLALSGEKFSKQLQIGSIVTIIDAKNIRIHQAGMMSPIIKNQALLADILVASKMPKDNSAIMDKTIDLQLAFANMPIITKNAWEFTSNEWQQILDRQPRSLDQMRQQTTRRMIKRQLLTTKNHPGFTSIAIEIDTDAMSKQDIEAALNKLITSTMPTNKTISGKIVENSDKTNNAINFGNIIRAKAILSYPSSREISWLVQVVEQQIEWRKTPPAPVSAEGDAASILIIIGMDLNEVEIRKLFEK